MENKGNSSAGRPWTKEELSLLCATERDGVLMLAIHVVRRWIADGKPKRDEEGVRVWLDYIRQSIHDEGDTYSIGE